LVGFTTGNSMRCPNGPGAILTFSFSFSFLLALALELGLVAGLALLGLGADIDNTLSRVKHVSH